MGADSYVALSSTGQNCTATVDSYCIISPMDCGQNLSITVIAKNIAGPSTPSDSEEFITCEHLFHIQHVTKQTTVLIWRHRILIDTPSCNVHVVTLLCVRQQPGHVYHQRIQRN